MSTDSKTATRVYLVSCGTMERLVRASHPSVALTHVARDTFVVAVPSQDDLIRCIRAGADIETAGSVVTVVAIEGKDHV